MYRGAPLACPSCGSSLVLSPASLTAHRCDACGGAWLGPEATVHLMQGVGDAADAELARVASEASSHASVRAPANAQGRACPTCGGALLQVQLAGVTVDSCAAHGTFFDRNEVDLVLEACRRYREARAHEGDITAAGVAEDAAAIVGGGAKLAARGAFEVLVSIMDSIFNGSARERERREAENQYYGRF